MGRGHNKDAKYRMTDTQSRRSMTPPGQGPERAKPQAIEQARTPVEMKTLQEKLADGTVSVLYSIFDEVRLIYIEEWSSLNPGQGNTDRALQELRNRYSGYRLIAYDATSMGAEDYWRAMKVKGLIDNLTDDDGQVIAKTSKDEYPDWVWQQGQCGTYACALIQMYPHLRLGVAGTSFEDGDDWWPHHYFAHDDTHAYDSLGKHSLPYRGNDGSWDVQELDQLPSDWGLPEEEAGPEGPEPSLEAAQAHARANRVLSETSAQSVIYHVSPRVERAAIQQQGLAPNAPEQWPAGVYLFADLANAQFFAQHQEEMAQEEYGAEASAIDIWQVNADGLRLNDDPAVTDDDPFQSEYPQAIRSAYSLEPITPDRLTLRN
jgi:hypothetical protein